MPPLDPPSIHVASFLPFPRAVLPRPAPLSPRLPQWIHTHHTQVRFCRCRPLTDRPPRPSCPTADLPEAVSRAACSGFCTGPDPWEEEEGAAAVEDSDDALPLVLCSLLSPAAGIAVEAQACSALQLSSRTVGLSGAE